MSFITMTIACSEILVAESKCDITNLSFINQSPKYPLTKDGRGCNMSSISNYSFTFCTQNKVNKSENAQTCNLSNETKSEDRKPPKIFVKCLVLTFVRFPFSIVWCKYWGLFECHRSVWKFIPMNDEVNNKRIKRIFPFCVMLFRDDECEWKTTTKWSIYNCWNWPLVFWSILTTKLIPIPRLTDYFQIISLLEKRFRQKSDEFLKYLKDLMVWYQLSQDRSS